MPGNALFTAGSFNAYEQQALSNQGIVLGPNSTNNFLDLIKGFVLFMPQDNISVQTREGIAYIPKGAQAWIMETGNDVAIYDLHDTLHTGMITVTANNEKIDFVSGNAALAHAQQDRGF